MAEFLVSSTSELVARLGQVNPGDTIYLAPGVYDPVTIRNLGALDVTIASQNPDDPAIITGFITSDTSDVRFSNLVFEAGLGETNAFQFASAENLVFSGVVVRGPDNVGSGEEVSPFLIRDSSNITIVDSEFYNVFHGVKLLDVDGIVISGSSFHDIRCDGIRGGGVSNAVITGNTFTDFYPIGNDHPDAIQFWSTNQDHPGRNLVITDNLVYRGDGAPTQGVFIRDTHDNLPFENLTITGNVVLGGLYNGISVDGVVGGELTNNIVIGYPDQRSWVRVNVDTHFDVSDNSATAYSFDTRDSHHYAPNAVIAENNDFYTSILNNWLGSGESLSTLTTQLLDAAVYTDPASSQELTSFETELTNIAGTWGADELQADATGSRLYGKAGDDVLLGNLSDDVLYGAYGNDYLTGGDGSDKLYGGVDNDALRGGAGNDRLFAGDGHDTLFGGAGNDRLYGGRGMDRMMGGEGNDKLVGGGGHDLLFGGEGDDILFGDWGNDQLLGGLGSDQFVFYANVYGIDTILDFESGSDRIVLTGLDADTTRHGNQAFTFIEEQAFSGTAGELRLEQMENGLMVQGDMDGDGVADFQVMVEGVDTLYASDFYF